MTREEQINILTEARDRALKQIELTEGCEMGTEEFQRLIYCAEQLRWMAQCHEDSVVPKPEQYDEPEEDEPKKDLPKIRIERVGNQMLAEVVEPEPAPAKATMSKEEIRDKLSTYSNKYDFLDVAAIMSEMGYGKLSDIPADRYGELIERVEAYIKEGV
ncbi:MAG: hypothetical protein IKY91_03465 [Akkermansia sp.]|nr:hypothetical protein [Akkermansia sp.]